MKSMRSVYQKYYSALKAVSEVDINNNFFENISLIDIFLLEFRNITFVVQKQMENEKEENLYQELLKKHLSDSKLKWLKEERNKVSKENPFNLKKVIKVEIYLINSSVPFREYTITLENEDYSSEEIINKIKKEFLKINIDVPELYFTLKYVFLNADDEMDVLEYIKYGIQKMDNFICDLEKELNVSDPVVDKIKSKIMEKYEIFNSKQLSFITDASFNFITKKIEFNGSANILFQDGNGIISSEVKKIPLNSEQKFLVGDTILDKFMNFIVFHIMIYNIQHTIMPTFIVIYKDDTFTIENIILFNKAVLYRKINEISKRVESEKIVTVLYVGENISYSKRTEKIFKLPSSVRQRYATEEYIAFSLLSKDYEEINMQFNVSKLNDPIYLKSMLNNPISNFENLSFTSIRNALRK